MTEFIHPPLVRHEALAPLSRDHYQGLVFAQRLCKASTQDAIARRKAVAECIDGWDHDVVPHFADEERLLSPYLTAHQHTRLLVEHHRLNQLAQQVRQSRSAIDPDAALLNELGTLLEKHIRWEERELFMNLQERLTAEQLTQMQLQSKGIEQARRRDVCRNQASKHDPTA